MDNKFFGIGSTYRSTIPDAKRAAGFGATQEPFEYINQALFELKTDHIIGTAAQLALGQCTCKYQSSDQTLRDSSGTEVTLTDGDRVYIIGLDTLTADFDLSAYDRLRVTVDPSISLGNGSQNLIFGDESVLDIHCANTVNITWGTNSAGFINHSVFRTTMIGIGMYPAKHLDVAGEIRASTGILFGTDTAAENRLDDYEEGSYNPIITGSTSNPTMTYTTNSGFYTKIGDIVHLTCNIVIASISGGASGSHVQISLPFTIASGLGLPVGPMLTSGVSFPSVSYTTVYAYGAVASTAVLYVKGTYHNGVDAYVDTDDLAAGDRIHFSLTYKV